MVTITEFVPIEKIKEFHKILCATGGRYLQNPYQVGERVRVHYETENYAAHNEAWLRVITPIKEVKKDQFWRIVIRRIKLLFQ